MKINKGGCCEQADLKQSSKNAYHKFLKRRKNRLERRKANIDPECVPGYGKYKGWET